MEVKKQLFDADHPLEIADQGCFFVGGSYAKREDGRIMAGQMFVQYQVPRHCTRPYPIVMIHGGGQTGSNFLSTPDGRHGWADFFVANGYAVYVVDQPGRGRSGYFPEVYGKTIHRSAEAVSNKFTAPEDGMPWPQAGRHTQWPGIGAAGDAVFDHFYASQVEHMADLTALEHMMREAGSALLDRVGPAVLLTHSQSGTFGWTIADARRVLVKGIVAVEPNGPPVYEIKFKGAPDFFEEDGITRAWGITRGPLRFEPSAAGAEEIKFVRQEKPEAPDLVRCWLQEEPARQLPGLKGIAILIVTAEASYHASFDHCTSRFLRQAGVEHTFVRLADVGIRGNAHMMMLERNNLEIATFLDQWIQTNVR